MGRTFEADQELTRDKHAWKFVRVVTYDWGVSVMFSCENPGCPTTVYIPCNPERESMGGVCFNTYLATEISDD